MSENTGSPVIEPEQVIYEVTYRVKNTRDFFKARAVIIDGYSTFADLPKIVTIPRDLKPEDIVITTVQALPAT